jgi:hypothetical protein
VVATANREAEAVEIPGGRARGGARRDGGTAITLGGGLVLVWRCKKLMLGFGLPRVVVSVRRSGV